MGPGYVVGVHPDVAGLCEVESELVVLGVILADIDVVAVAADVVKGLADGSAGAAFFAGFVKAGPLFPSPCVPANKSAVLELLPDLGQVALARGEIQGCADALEMVDLRFDFFGQGGQSLIGPLELGISVKIFLRVLGRRQHGIERNADLLAGVVVVHFTGLRAFGNGIGVGVEKLSIDPVFVALFGIPDLLELQVVFVNVAFENCLDDMAKVH